MSHPEFQDGHYALFCSVQIPSRRHAPITAEIDTRVKSLIDFPFKLKTKSVCDSGRINNCFGFLNDWINFQKCRATGIRITHPAVTSVAPITLIFQVSFFLHFFAWELVGFRES